MLVAFNEIKFLAKSSLALSAEENVNVRKVRK